MYRAIILVSAVSAMPLLAGCRHMPLGAIAPAAALAHAPRSAAAPASVKANELGRIPILMYHSIGASTTYRGKRWDRLGLNISSETFRKDLQMMYDAGFYPVNVRDIATPRIDVPAGKTPVAITFDDARGSQFHYLKNGRIDPTCAVGVLEAFHARHPDWPLKATFYVLPASSYNPVPFWQRGKETEKLRYLAKQGFEVANHSTTHHPMGPMDAAKLRWELATCERYVAARVPGLHMETMALPYGISPRSHAAWPSLLDGTDGGTSYHYKAVVLAAGEPSYPPAHRRYNPIRIMRVGSEPGYIERWIKQLKAGHPYRRYISDGDPGVITVPKTRLADLNRKALGDLRVSVYDDGAAKARPRAAERQRKPATAKKDA